jgi:hypothetical protein
MICAPHPIQFWATKSRRMRWAGHVVYTRERAGVYRVLVGKPQGKRPLVRTRHRWEHVTWKAVLYVNMLLNTHATCEHKYMHNLNLQIHYEASRNWLYTGQQMSSWNSPPSLHHWPHMQIDDNDHSICLLKVSRTQSPKKYIWIWKDLSSKVGT